MTERKTHLILGPSPAEAAMLQSYDLFEQLLSKKPTIAAVFASETLAKAKELTATLKSSTQKKVSQ